MIWNPDDPRVKVKRSATGAELDDRYLNKHGRTWEETLVHVRNTKIKNWYLGPRELGEWNDI